MLYRLAWRENPAPESAISFYSGINPMCDQVFWRKQILLYDGSQEDGISCSVQARDTPTSRTV